MALRQALRRTLTDRPCASIFSIRANASTTGAARASEFVVVAVHRRPEADRALVDAGVIRAVSVPPRGRRPGLNFAGWARKLTGKPSITVGSVGLQAEFIGPLLRGESAPKASLDELADFDAWSLAVLG